MIYPTAHWVQLFFKPKQVKQLTSQVVHLLVEVSANVDEGQFVELIHVFKFKKVLVLQEVHEIDVV